MSAISIIIPTYNSAQFVHKAIESAANQTKQAIEIICVDNNSTDNTLQILESLSLKFNLIILKATKQGAAAARNEGLKIAKGDWIQFVDADDILYSDKLERQNKLIQSNTKLIIGAYDMCVNNGPVNKFEIEKKDPWLLLINSGMGNTVSNLWNRNLLISIGGWNENYSSSQEYELMFRILKKINSNELVFDYVASMLYNRRLNDSISNNYETNTMTRIELRNQFKNYFLNNSLINKNELLNAVQNFILKDIRFLYLLNKTKALSLYSETIDSDFKPEKSFVTPWYFNLLYNICGYKLTETIFSIKNHSFSNEKEHHF
jgi:glycosyltransferase involved in cell wall biosynthesis